MRHNWKSMVIKKLEILNSLSYLDHEHRYYVDNNSMSYALFYGGSRVSSYLPMATLWEWMDGYMTGLQQMHKQQLAKDSTV